MSLSKWLREYSRFLQPGRMDVRRGRWSRQRFQSGQHTGYTRAVRGMSELLEDRVLPATFAWVGDVNTHWAANVGGNTNWSSDGMPADGDSLVFGSSGPLSLENHFAAGNSYSMTFNAGGYTITGQSIALDHSGTDVIQIAGENLLQTPLELSASEFEVQSGILIIDSTVTGTGGLTKTGAGTLVASEPAEWSGATTVAVTLHLVKSLQQLESDLQHQRDDSERVP
jgi:hypothetical protein